MQQQQHDGTWLDVFDFSRCMNQSTRVTNNTSIVNESNTQIINNETNWNNSSQNITTFVPALANADEIDQFTVMCYALDFIYSILEDAAYERLVNPVTSGLLPALAGAIVTAGATAASMGATAPALLGSVTTVVVSAGTFLNGSIAADQMTANREEIVCYMYQNIVSLGSVPNETQFSELLDGCEIGQLVAISVLSDILASHDVYLAFLRYCAELVPLSSAGLLPECPCSSEWEYTADISALAAWTDYNVYSDQGTFVGGSGWTGGTPPNNPSRCGFGINFAATTNITYVEFETTAVMSGNWRQTGWGGMPDVSPSGIRTETSTIEAFTLDESLIGLVIYRAAGTGGDTTPITSFVVRVTVRGSGYQPPELGG
jgi:hypothetical protein